MTDEPEDGAYVLMVHRDYPPDSMPFVFRRQDGVAYAGGVGDKHWWNRSNLLDYPKSWQELTELGDIAYVGQFVDRSRRTETADPLPG